MNHLAKNRFLLCVLIALLQVAMLPGQGRLRCMLRSHSLACCCATHTATEAGGDATSGRSLCCARHEVQLTCCCERPSAAGGMLEESGGDDPDSDCHCGDGAAAPLVAVDVEPTTAKDLGQAAMLAGDCFAPVCAPVDGGKFVTARIIPRARTGPPLHVLFEVFLI